MNPALFAALLSFAPADHGRPERPVVERSGHGGYEVGCPRDVDAAFSAFDQALHELADDVDGLRGRERRRLREDLITLARAAEEARERSCRSAARPPVVVVPAPPPPPPPPRAIVMSDAAHRQVVQAMKQEGFDEGRLRIIDTAVRGELCVTSTQTRDLMKTVSFSSGRLDVLRRLAPRLIDDGEAIVIYQALDFNGDKDDARSLLTTTKTLPFCRVP
ncbi:MAG: DUF4476 domain-containing protein [Deltaproteobacteria bacterium]|nr:DUF4476 domain-containing protein [Deltaproteobacteria bacterium]